MWLPLLQDGPFGVKPAQGEVRLLLTYKSYVDQDREDAGRGGAAGAPGAALSSAPGVPTDVVAYIKVFGSDEGESGSSDGLGLAEGDSSEEGDSDGERERERELQRERAAKGLDRFGVEPGVEVVASNVGHFDAGASGDPLLSDPSLDSSLADRRLVDPSLGPFDALPLTGSSSGGDRDREGAPLATTSGAPLAPVEGKNRGILGGVWSATKAVTLGAVGVAGGVVGATAGLVAGLGGAVVSGVGSVGRAVGGFVSRQQNELPEEPLYYYEDDDYFSQDPMSVRVRSYPEDGSEQDEGDTSGSRRARRGLRRGDGPRGYYDSDDVDNDDDDTDEFGDEDDDDSGGDSGITRSLTLGERPDDYFDGAGAGAGVRGPYSDEDIGADRDPRRLPGAPVGYLPGAGEPSGVPAAFDDYVRGAQQVGQGEGEGEGEHDEERQGAGAGTGGGLGTGVGLEVGVGVGLSPATLEQRVARLVEFNLDHRQDPLRGIAASPRLETALGGEEESEESGGRGERGERGEARGRSGGGSARSSGGVGRGEQGRERRERGRDGSPRRGKSRGAGAVGASGRGSLRARGTGPGTPGTGAGAGGPGSGGGHPQEGVGSGSGSGTGSGSDESNDRWRSVQGAISDLMDFFSR